MDLFCMTFRHCDNTVGRRGKRRIDYGCNGFTASVLLQASCTVMSDVTLRGGDLLTQNCTSVAVVENWV